MKELRISRGFDNVTANESMILMRTPDQGENRPDCSGRFVFRGGIDIHL